VSAAREGGRVASFPSAVSSSAVKSRIDNYLEGSGISPDSANVTITPTDLSSLETGDNILIVVTLPVQEALWLQAFPSPNINLSARISYERE